MNYYPVEYGKIKIMGKEINTPRWQQPYGRDYNFSGMNHSALPINDEYLVKLLEFVNNHSGKQYNGILINWYQNGYHYIGKHSDDEKSLIKDTPIYSFSFGQERDFRITSKKKEIDPISIKLKNNSLIIMGGKMQEHYYHEVPKRSLSSAPNRRINVTLRAFK
jgi:alkylated DNA repair dioxygenase AlkB